MNKLYYICQWGNDRKKAWSGTYLKLFDSLKNHFDLIDTPIQQSFYTKIRNAMVNRELFLKYDFAYSALKNAGKKAINSINDSKFCTFQYAELPIRPNAHNYIYIDMCAQYINDVIMTTPSFRDHYFRKNADMKALKKRCESQNRFFKECAGIFTMSEWLAKYIVEELGIDSARVHYVGAGVDINVNNISPNRAGNKILFVGRSFEAKGGYIVVKAFKILKEKYMKNAELYILGPASNPLSEEIEGVFYKGALPVEQVLEYYNTCDIFCMPSYIDAFGKVFVEALCCGLPCIGRSVLSMSEIIKDGKNGYNIHEDDEEYLAKRMYDLLLDKSIKQYVEDHRKEYQNRYSWDTVTEKISSIINKDEYMRT